MTRGFSRRGALQLMITATGATLAAACAPTTAAPTSPPAATPAAKPAATTASTPGASPVASAVAAASPSAAAIQPRSGGTLLMGHAVEIGTLDGHRNQGQASYDYFWSIFDRLTEYDTRLQPQPMLAESWETSADGKQIKLNLRKGVQFHNKRELTSEDIKWNMMRVRDPKVAASQLAVQSSWFQEIETPDKYTVILKSDVPRPAVFDFFEYFTILDKDNVEGPTFTSTAIGTGAFSLGEWVQGDHVTLVKNPNYYRSGKPYLNEVRVNIRRDLPTLTSQLEAGSLDIAMGPTVQDFARLRNNPRFQTAINQYSGSVAVIMLNTTQPALQNKTVRQAFNYAINRKRYVDIARGGIGTPGSLPWTASSPAWDEAKNNTYAFDLDKARSLLRTAGVSNLEVDYVFFTGNTSGGLAPIYQGDLTSVGIKMNIKEMELAQWLPVVNAQTRSFNGIAGGASTYANLEPFTMLSSSTAWNFRENSPGFQNENYTRLVTAASSEPDAAKRKALYSQINDIILDESFTIPIAPTPPYAIFAPKVQGIAYTQHEGFDLANVWLTA